MCTFGGSVMYPKVLSFFPPKTNDLVIVGYISIDVAIAPLSYPLQCPG